MAASASSGLSQLYEEFGDRVTFVTIYVREAHPGERVSQPQTFEDKVAHARAYALRDDIRWPVAVDDLDGSVHHSFGRLPDAAYVVDQEGRVAARVLWSNDCRGLRAALRSVVRQRAPAAAERNATLLPLIRGMGVTHEVLRAAGRTAQRDMMLTAPPLYGLARVASIFRPLPPAARGFTALIAAGAFVLLARHSVRRLRGRQS